MRGTSAIVKIISQSATSISSTPEGWLDIMVIVFHQDHPTKDESQLRSSRHLWSTAQSSLAQYLRLQVVAWKTSMAWYLQQHVPRREHHYIYYYIGIIWKTCDKFRTLQYHSVSYLDDTLSFECCKQNVLQAQSQFIARVASKKQSTHWCTLLDTIVDRKHVELCAENSIHFEKLAGTDRSRGCHGLQYQTEHSRSRFQPCQSRRIRSKLLPRKSARSHPNGIRSQGCLKRLLATRNSVDAILVALQVSKSIAKHEKRSSVCLTSAGSLSATSCQSIYVRIRFKRMYPLRMLEIWEAVEFGWSSMELIAGEVNTPNTFGIHSNLLYISNSHTQNNGCKLQQQFSSDPWSDFYHRQISNHISE